MKLHNEFWNKCKLSQIILKNKFSNSIGKSRPKLDNAPNVVPLTTSDILTVSNNNNDKSNNLSNDVTLKFNDDVFNDCDGEVDDVDDDEDINYDYFGDLDVDLNTTKFSDIENNKSVNNDTPIQFQTINADSTTNNNYSDIVDTNKINIYNDDDDKVKTLAFQCKACTEYFKTEQLLVQHILMVHKIDDDMNNVGKKIKLLKPTTTSTISLPLPPLPQPKQYQCDLCDMICKSLEDLRHHKKIHYGNFIFNYV